MVEEVGVFAAQPHVMGCLGIALEWVVSKPNAGPPIASMKLELIYFIYISPAETSLKSFWCYQTKTLIAMSALF